MPMPHPSMLLIEGSDFESFPIGGQLTMTRALRTLYGNQLALVGIGREKRMIGRWIKREFDGIQYWFFPVGYQRGSSKRPLLPARLSFYLGLRRFRQEIQGLGCRSAFLQAPESLFAVARWGWEHLAYWFAGVENPLKISRYPAARPLWRVFDRAWFSALRHVDAMFAAADEAAISALVARSNGRLARGQLKALPTCVDPDFPQGAIADVVRKQYGIPGSTTVCVTVGRINRVKGWELLLETFERFLVRQGDALLCFVGDGEDRPLLEEQIKRRRLSGSVRITGFVSPVEVSGYLSAADLAVFGSFVEGWSVAMLEALACGKAMVSTEVSGIRDLIEPGLNGFVVTDRDPDHFADAMGKALNLPHAAATSRAIADRFGLARMGHILAETSPLLRAMDSCARAEELMCRARR